MSPEDAKAVTEAMEAYAAGVLKSVEVELPPLISPFRLHYDTSPILLERL